MICLLILVPYKLFVYLLNFLTFIFLIYFLTHFLPYLCTSSKLRPFCFQARDHRRRPNLALVFLCLSWVIDTCLLLLYFVQFFICPIAIAYTMGQIIKSFCVCVCVSVRLWTLSRSHFFVDFHQIGHRRVNPPKSKNEFVGGQYRPTPSSIFPLKHPFLTQRSWKLMEKWKTQYLPYMFTNHRNSRVL